MKRTIITVAVILFAAVAAAGYWSFSPKWDFGIMERAAGCFGAVFS